MLNFSYLITLLACGRTCNLCDFAEYEKLVSVFKQICIHFPTDIDWYIHWEHNLKFAEISHVVEKYESFKKPDAS